MQLPLLDQPAAVRLETATFSLGCFWGPDARFGSIPGVVRTRVGYAGGGAEPGYRTLSDHIETLQLDFNPQEITYPELLEQFFSQHSPTKPAWKRQYAAAVFYHGQEQEQQLRVMIEKVAAEKGTPLHTLIYPYSQFYRAEERHQKYKLQRYPMLLQEYRTYFPVFQDLVDSTAVARVNGYLNGNGTLEQLQKELPLLGLSPEGQQLLWQAVAAG